MVRVWKPKPTGKATLTTPWNLRSSALFQSRTHQRAIHPFRKRRGLVESESSQTFAVGRARRMRHAAPQQLRQMQRLTPVVSVQNRYNLGDRSSESMVDLCDSESIVFLPWAPLQNIDDVVPARTAARRLNVTARQIALAWLLGRSAQILPIPGSGSAEHVADNVAAASLELTVDEANAILQLAQ